MKILHLNTPLRDRACVNAMRPTLDAPAMARKLGSRTVACGMVACGTVAQKAGADAMDAAKGAVRAW